MKPEVSVVMSVFNGADTLSATLDSVLSQGGIDLELIAVDDGSTDESGQILTAYAARDPRVIVLRQENRGLTAALIRGCELARGEFIARQDAGGDISLPDRLADQLAFLRSRPAAVMSACGVRFVDAAGVTLYEVAHTDDELNDRLRIVDTEKVRGVSHHGSVMIRRDAYLAVGGYRPQFSVAQDLDLWLRLSERGLCLGQPKILYQTVVRPNSISFIRRHEQIRTRQTIIACAKMRRNGGSDKAIVDNWVGFQHSAGWPDVARRLLDRFQRKPRFYYFVAGSLRESRPELARRYYLRALTAGIPKLASLYWLMLLARRTRCRNANEC
jgi:glycosyltransferase involved in cell wall biosynthesis